MTPTRARQILRDHWGDDSEGRQLRSNEEREIKVITLPKECYLDALHRVAGLPVPAWGGRYQKAFEDEGVRFYSELKVSA